MIRKDTPMDQKSVITVKDITAIALKERKPGCEKGTLHDDAPVQTALYRVQPGSGVPTHEHAQVYDLFIGLKGVLKFGTRANAGTACSFSNLARSVECRPVCGMSYRIRAKPMRHCSYSFKPRAQSSITCRSRSAKWKPRCRFHQWLAKIPR